MKLYKRKGSRNWYLRQGDTLISLKTTRKGLALQLLEEHLASFCRETRNSLLNQEFFTS